MQLMHRLLKREAELAVKGGHEPSFDIAISLVCWSFGAACTVCMSNLLPDAHCVSLMRMQVDSRDRMVMFCASHVATLDI
jgi:hypothetical protein